MKRREFITLSAVGGGWPLSARAQQAERLRRIGVLMTVARVTRKQGLRRGIPREVAAARVDRRPQRANRHPLGRGRRRALRRFAKELIALRRMSFLHKPRRCGVAAGDPHRADRIRKSCRPGRPVSLQPGAARRQRHRIRPVRTTIAGKWLELLKEIAPRITRGGLRIDPASGPYAGQFVEPIKSAALSSGVEAIPSTVHDKSEIEIVIASICASPTAA